MKSCLVITSMLIILIPISGASDLASDQSSKLTSSVEDGLWVNQTLTINGTTTLNPQSADWVLYDRTEPHTEWPVLRSGDFFTTVLPISEGLWNWSLTIDVFGLNCTCWLEIGQPDGLGKEFLNRIVFIGEGPHNPVIIENHDSSIVIDGSEEISFNAILSDSQSNDTSMILSWCFAPNGACDGQTFSSQVDVSWDGNFGSIEINVSDLGLSDGIWQFTYSLQDVFLRLSPHVELTVFVDQNDPTSSLIAPDLAQEGEIILIDGSGSSDGVWSNNLQSIWYITGPDGVTYVPNSNTTNGLLYVSLNESGNYTIRLDVIDWVGRMSSANTTLLIENVVPSIELGVKGSDVNNPNSWQILESEELEIFTMISDTGSDVDSIIYSWYLDGELVSNSENLTLENLDAGQYQLNLSIVDDNGATDYYEMELTVKPKPKTITDEFSIAGIIVILGIIGFGILIFKRMNSNESNTTSLPKWDGNTNQKTTDSGNLDSDENQLWD